MSTAPFPVQQDLTAIAMVFQNQRLIADMVCPRIAPVGSQEAAYGRWNLSEGFTVPNTQVGRTSLPTRVEFNGTQIPIIIPDYALDDLVPNVDVINSELRTIRGVRSADPVKRAVAGLTNLIMLDREIRVANLFTTLGTYLSTHRITLSGTAQFNDFVNSNPINVIMTGLDTCVVRPNIMTIGRPAWTILSQHPKIAQAINASAQNSAVVTRQQVAALFELDEVIVGDAFVNTARKGQAPTLSRAWGKHIVLSYRSPMMAAVDDNIEPTFAITVPFGERVSGSMPQPQYGARGSQLVRVAESVAEVIPAQECGYFIQNAVA
jgi:hypothetical protein